MLVFDIGVCCLVCCLRLLDRFAWLVKCFRVSVCLLFYLFAILFCCFGGLIAWELLGVCLLDLSLFDCYDYCLIALVVTGCLWNTDYLIVLFVRTY